MKKYLLLFLLTLLCPLFGQEHLVIEDQSSLEIETPALAKRATRKIVLPNGLEAFLISDPDTPESGAALSINVGSWDDPEGRPGMAHFVEHMLFLGTTKYPDEKGYTRYLDEHGGTRNAFTMNDRTVYMFSINNSAFSEGLDRFGQFFVAPLFSPSGVDRECKAIHQEFCRGVPMDAWRTLHVKKELGNPQHKMHAFSMGNSTTLAQISQDELKEWYKSHYSANLMHLVVYASSDLDTMEKEVVSIFSDVKNLDITREFSTATLTTPNQHRKLVTITPVQDLQLLELSWELPRFYGQDLRMHVDKLVSHVLGHEGNTSLLAQLKRENLAEGLSAGTYRAGDDQMHFNLSVHLTSKGLKNYETVIMRCFEGIASIQKSGIPRYTYDEIAQLEELHYRFQSREQIFNLVTEHATRMIDEPLATFPQQSILPSIFSAERVDAFLAHLTPKNCLFTLIADPRLSKITPTRQEQWFDVAYSVLPIANRKIKAWSEATPHRNICVSRPNPFLPDRLAVSAAQKSHALLPTPTCCCDTPKSKIYSCTDSQYGVPEVCWIFNFKTPTITNTNPSTQILADLYCHAVNERLSTAAYEAQMANLSYTLKPKQDSIELKISGFSPKAPELLQSILLAMQHVQPTKEEFVLYRERLARDYYNTVNSSPIKQGGEMLRGILYKTYVGPVEKGQFVHKVNYKKLQHFCAHLFDSSYVEATLYGQQTDDQSRFVTTLIDEAFVGTPYPPEKHERSELAQLSCDNQPVLLTRPSDHPANALILTVDCGDFSFQRRAAHEILTKGLEEPFFSELRTRQQTAYLVTNWSQELERHLYAYFAIQSSSHDTRDLLSRFELFLESSLQHLSENIIPIERFEAIRASLVHAIENRAENLSKMGHLLHTIAFDYDADFDWLNKRIEGVKTLTYRDFLSYADEFLGKSNPRRMAICVNGELPDEGRISYQVARSTRKVRKQIDYKSR